MPIRRERRWWYPIDWPNISLRIRFEVDGPHGQTIRVLPDGRWFDPEIHTWCDDRGREASWPDVIEGCAIRKTRVVLAACHLDHDPGNVKPKNLAAWCQRHHMLHDREFHRSQAWITILLRRAAGDLFHGPYRYRRALQFRNELLRN